ncbi:MAG TPA: glycosyltransferase family 2 protein [Blastocatellia bacterium]|nr:glycosyltransferase family 2 protein [Blastocatellia bacterium]
MLFLIALSVAALILLLVVVWNVAAWPQVSSRSRSLPRGVSVLVPARNEENNIAACLDSILRQGKSVGEILVYDDHSTDRTASIARSYFTLNHRVRVIEGAELPQGWCGKNFACAELAKQAVCEWLLFLDADARLSERAVERMLEEAYGRDVTMLSCWPRLEVESFSEKLLMPMLNFVVFTLFPAPLSLRRNDESLGLSHGACIMMSRAEYESIGGHAAVKDEIFEDTRLAALWRARGLRGLCLDGQTIVSVRMYRSVAEIWGGFQKNFFPAFRREASFWLFLALHLFVFLAPFILLVPAAMGLIRIAPVATAAASVLLMRLLLAVRFGHPLWPALLHPLAEAFLIALGISSWWRCKTGRGVAWKGRRYRATEAG